MAWCVPHIPFSPEPEYSRALRLRDVAVCALQGNQSLTDFMAKKAPVTEPPLVISTFDESKTNINYPKDVRGTVLLCAPSMPVALRALAPDVEIHAHAAALADAQERAFDARAASFGPGAPLSAQMQAFERLQAQVNQSCEYGNVNMGGLIGQDCYTMDAGESAQWSVMSAAAASR